MKTLSYIATGFLALCLIGRAQAQLTYIDSQAQHTATVTGYNGTLTGALIIPSTHTVGGVTFTVVGIAAKAFLSQTGLASVIIPDTVVSIGASAFQGCTALTSATLSAGLTEIGASAFAGCSQLTAIIIPNGVTTIGSNAFNDCTSLIRLTLPNNVTTVGNSAFQRCSGLTMITIGSAVTSLGSNVFSQCSALTTAIFLGNAPATGTSLFFQTGSGFTVYYFDGAASFTSPSWTDSSNDVYPSVDMGAASPVKPWLMSYGFAYNTDPTSDPNGDGVSLLLAYALNLDPRLNLSGSLPQPVLTADQFSLTYYAGSAGITYTVETSTDLVNWTTNGVGISAAGNGFYAGSIAKSSGPAFLHLKISAQ